ncbi:hypothetical protein J6590_011813 [Homalodisca vitripennis]|nr:hypothetical protein J6590_011813 [Homalodisca vitripennis]
MSAVGMHLASNSISPPALPQTHLTSLKAILTALCLYRQPDITGLHVPRNTLSMENQSTGAATSVFGWLRGLQTQCCRDKR